MVLHVSTPGHWRGGEQQVAYLAKGLSALEVSQVVLCPANSALSKRLMEENLPVTTFEKRGIMGISLARKISALVASHNITIIHCHDSHAHTSAVLSNQFSGKNIPLIVSRRVAFPISGSPLSSWKYNHPSIRRIICVSHQVQTTIEKKIQDQSKLCVIYDGIDVDKYTHKRSLRKLYTELGLAPDTILVGNLSALSASKDFPTFLDVAASVCKANPRIRVIIAGEGPERKAIEKKIIELKLENKVILLGFREDVVDVMQSLSLFLFTSRIEGLGTIVLEAFAAKVPVVATRAGGIPELVEDQKTGLLAAPGDIKALADGVLHLLNDREFANSISTRAFEKVQAFRYERTAAQTLEEYQKIS